MKASEFYEKHWKIKNPDGTITAPPFLSDKEKDFLDSCSESEYCSGVYFGRKRRRSTTINIQMLKEDMEKMFPKYFMPANQPKLDKYGAPEKED